MNAAAAPRTAKKKRVRWMLIALAAVVAIVLGVALPLVTGAREGAVTPVPTATAEPGEL
jgi:flagellar basal body-associated protein FliL